MITIFSIPKPFIGHTGIIQENAVRSWVSCAQRAEVILLGDEPGVAEISKQYGCIHIPDIQCNEYGTPHLSEAFRVVQEKASFDLICYVNGDIIFFSGIGRAINAIPFSQYLLVGRRTNLDIHSSYNPEDNCQVFVLGERIAAEGEPDQPWAIDYFIFPKHQIQNMPRFVVGRAGWDNWMIWFHSRVLQVPVIDASGSILAIHQRHDYGHVKSSTGLEWEGSESDENRQLMGGWERRYYSILDSNYYILPNGKVMRTRISGALLKQKGKRMIAGFIPDSLLQKIRIKKRLLMK